MGGVKRRRLDLSSWREVMRRFDAAGTSVQAFCAGEGLSATSFYRWRERLEHGDHEVVAASRRGATPAARARSAVGFVELGGLLAGGGSAFELKLDLGGGVLLQLTRR
jgi:hypothetical protein